MNKLYYFFILLIISFPLLGQSPESFNYQAVLWNTDGSIIANESVTLEIYIIQGTADGTIEYSEVHNTETTAIGLISLVIGEGQSSDNFSSIDWSNGPYYIKVSLDGTEIGTSQIMSVPYALYAKTSEDSFSGDYCKFSNTTGQILL